MATAPIVTPGPGAGAGASASASGDDGGGVITLNAGTLPGLGAIAELAFNEGYAAPPTIIVLTPANDEAALLGELVFVPLSSLAATGFSLAQAGTVPLIKSGIVYQWYWTMLEGG